MRSSDSGSLQNQCNRMQRNSRKIVIDSYICWRVNAELRQWLPAVQSCGIYHYKHWMSMAGPAGDSWVVEHATWDASSAKY